jgi:hypothetical protein
MQNIVEKYFSISIAHVRSRGGRLVKIYEGWSKSNDNQ